MAVRELAIEILNQPGQLVRVTSILAEAKVNIRGITASSTGKRGWIRMVVDKPEKAEQVLDDHGILPEAGEAVAVKLVDEPGALDQALRVLAESRINLDYIYTCIGKQAHRAIAVLGVQTPCKVEKLLQEKGIEVVTE